MRQVLSWVLAMSCLFPAGLSAQQEALFLKIITEVQRSSRPTVDRPVEATKEEPLLEDVWEEYREEPEATDLPPLDAGKPAEFNP